MQKSRAGQPVSEETVVTYRAARAFLFSEWFGALLMVASFTQLYVLILAKIGSGKVAVGLGLFLLAVGSLVFWRSHQYYVRLEFPWKKRWDSGAIVVAGSGVIFWLLFALLAVLTALGIKIL